MSFWTFTPYFVYTQMTTSALTVDNASLLAEFTGGSTTDVSMMIGIGLVKDSDAIFFQYMGEEQSPVALMLPSSGKPLTRLSNVRLSGIDIAEDVGEFKSTKLNLFLESSQGRTVMLTSGLNTIWSQCVITALMGMFNSYDLDTAFTLDSWKGNSKMRPCFAAIRLGTEKVSDQMLYDQLAEARSDRDQTRVQQIMRDSVEILRHSVSGGPVDAVTVVDETSAKQEEF